jgi:ACS family hexuronate transporter-like MFS transporter
LKKTVRGLRWWIIGLIAVVTVVNYIDRNALAIMWPSIYKDLGLTEQEAKNQLKYILTFFMIGYAISQSISGKIYDKIGTRRGFVMSILIWSVSSALHGISTSTASFSAFRTSLGFGEAGTWPGAAKSNAEWFPIKERALAQGIFNAGASIGAIISAPLIAYLFITFGWRITFPIIATFSLAWLVPWLITNKKLPKEHPWITHEERDYILNGQQVGTASAGPERVLSWSELLSYKQAWSVIVSRFFLDPIWWMFISWLPFYLYETFKFDVKQIGYFAWVPYVGAAAGSFSGGWFSGYLIKKGWTANKARKMVIAIGNLICFPALLATAVASSPLTAVLFMAVILFGFQVSINNIQTLPSDFLTGKSVGSLAGLSGMSAAFGVLISMWFVPWLTQGGHWAPFFIMGAVMVPLGMVSLFSLAGEIKRIQLKVK